MKRAIFLILAVMMLTAAGCNREESLNGTYTDEAGSASYIFSDDGRVSSVMGETSTEIGTFTVEGRNVLINGSPKGTVKGSKFTETGGNVFTKEK
jgi:hypothetical protein